MLPCWAKLQSNLHPAVFGFLCNITHTFLHRVARNYFENAKETCIVELRHNYIKANLVSGLSKYATGLKKIARYIGVKGAEVTVAGVLGFVYHKDGIAVLHLPNIGHTEFNGQHILDLFERSSDFGIGGGDTDDLFARQLPLIAVYHLHLKSLQYCGGVDISHTSRQTENKSFRRTYWFRQINLIGFCSVFNGRHYALF